MWQLSPRQKEPNNIKVISIQVSPTEKPNPEKKGMNIIINYITKDFVIGSLIGIHRLYLFRVRRIINWLSYIYSAILICFTIIFNIQNSGEGASYTVVKDTNAIEYILLIIFSITSGRNNLKNFFDHLSSFDVALNLSSHLSTTSPNIRFWFWLILIFTNSAIEFVLILIYAPDFVTYSLFWSYLTIWAHDCEQLLFCTLLRMIMTRAIILKEHVVKTFAKSNSDEERKLSVVEALSNNAQLDISSLHRNYELLHKCAELLNSVINLPMTLMLFCSGLCTTMLLKNLYKQLQEIDTDVFETRTLIIHCVGRCIKYTLLVIIPCYISSFTTTQISHIRTILHDAMNGVKNSKMERRRVKAFFQLTRENEFAYALWGVIKLNMSLPLSYLSLCTTYLVIMIQFSKFID